MSETQNPEDCMQPGKIGWNELTTTDPAAAIKFYTALFGWETEKFPSPDVDYTLFKHGGQAFGGVINPEKEGAPTMWINYVIVEDVDAKVAQSTSLGGKVCMPPTDIAMVGRIAIITDPQGALIGLHQPLKQ